MSLEDALKEFNDLKDTWIYRYRGFTPLSLKELTYGEIYFSYPEELNDPLDLCAELFVSKNSDYVYKFLLTGAFKSIQVPRNKPLSDGVTFFVDRVSAKYSQHKRYVSELLLDENIYWSHEVFNNCDLGEIYNFKDFVNSFRNMLINLSPDSLLSVSFSKSCKNPLLWSIYAQSHKGYCLIFDTQDQHLNIKDSINTEYEKYKCENINYCNDMEVDLSLMFDAENNFNYQNLYDQYFPDLVKKGLLTKNSNWLKEEEIRIHKGVNTNFSHRSPENKLLTSYEKTHYFDSSQLIGVIFGYQMTEFQKLEIEKIFEGKNNNFRLYQAYAVGNEIQIGFVKGTIY